MSRQIGTVFICIVLLVYVCGCGTIKDVSMDEYQRDPHSGIKSVRLTSGDTLRFNSPQHGDGTLVDGEIVGTQKDGTVVHTPVSMVASVSYYDAQTGQIVGIASGVLVATGVLLVFGMIEGMQNHSYTPIHFHD